MLRLQHLQRGAQSYIGTLGIFRTEDSGGELAKFGVGKWTCCLLRARIHDPAQPADNSATTETTGSAGEGKGFGFRVLGLGFRV